MRTFKTLKVDMITPKCRCINAMENLILTVSRPRTEENLFKGIILIVA